MKKIFQAIRSIAIIAIVAVMVLAGCSGKKATSSSVSNSTPASQDPVMIQTQAQSPAPSGGSSGTVSESVLINDVMWATRNVDAPGTFARSPETPGMFFQWNRKKGWAATGDVNGWDDTTPVGDEWETANDPSPAGYRVPTAYEMESLLKTSQVSTEWTTLNGVQGMRFTDKGNGNSIFLPAVGYRHRDDGEIRYRNEEGNYWTSGNHPNAGGRHLIFDYSDVGASNARGSGFSVRPVKN